MKLDTLRRYAVARTLFTPTTLPKAIAKLGFVQADPIRAPARAQDLTLRHRVKGYCVGDLEQRYPRLAIEEDFFVNYGYLPRATQALMHPRTPITALTPERHQQMVAVLAFVQTKGVAHPREVDAHFALGKSINWFGGSSNASTQLLDDMHYRGLLRIAGRAKGVRTYSVGSGAARLATPDALEEVPDPQQAMDAFVDVIVNKYAPLPEPSLRELINHLRGGAPQWAHLRHVALARAKERLASATVDGQTYYWPANENPASRRHVSDEVVRLLAPFDPLVWDRRRFEHLWGWAYRFEAYTPAQKRVRGYYALPLLWHEQVIGWGNVSVAQGEMQVDLGFVAGKPPGSAAFRLSLAQELTTLRAFLNLLGADARLMHSPRCVLPHAVSRLRAARLARSAKPFLARGGSRVERCPACRVALTHCLCGLCPQVPTRAGVCLLMADIEPLKPSNTGWLIADVVADTFAFGWARTEVDPELLALFANPQWQPYLVFPGEYVQADRVVNQLVNPELTEGTAARRPLFVLLDATWPEARKMFRKSPYLDHLPVLSLQPEQLSNYRLRRSTRDDHLCTSEVAALCLALSGDTLASEVLGAHLDVFTAHYLNAKQQLPVNWDDAAHQRLKSLQGI